MIKRGITIDRVLSLSSNPKIKPVFKPVNNFLIDYYLNGFKKIRQKTEKKSIVLFNYFTLFSYMVCISKFAVGMAVPLSYETKLIIFDITYFFGGIEFYNEILFLLSCIISMVINVELRLADRKWTQEWTLIFEMTRSKVGRLYMSSDSDILNKLSKTMGIIYKMTTVLYFTFSKSLNFI